MNVYDFDGTIFHPESPISFMFWCMNRHAGLWFTYFPKTVISVLLWKAGKKSYTRLALEFFRFLRIPDFDVQIERFWDKRQKRISSWYLAQKKPDDLIISASPSCIIEPIARRLGVRFAATEYDREFSVFTGTLMLARNKAQYIIDQGFPVIENFYSEDLVDSPIAMCAEKAHLVTHHAQKVTDWPHLNPETMKKVRRKINTGWTIRI